MALTDAAIRAAKPREARYKLYDTDGLILLVQPSGGKLWRLKYRHLGTEKQLALGTFPEVGLADARQRRDGARKLIAAGQDPAFEKKRAAVVASVSAANTFKAVADEFIDKRVREGAKPPTTAKQRWLLSLGALALGARPISEIQPYELLAVLRTVEKSGRHETANRLLALAGQVFRYAIATARADRNIAADLQGALISPQVTHYAAIIDPVGVGGLMRAIEGFDGQPATHWALRLAPHVFVRPGELRKAEWQEIDLEAAVWRIPAGRMKMGREHVVPLSIQAVTILKDAQRVTGGHRYVFPGVRTPKRPMSENTLNAALRRLGYAADEMTAHGFRSTACTLLNESSRWSPDAIERALAHSEPDKVRGAYNRGPYWAERVKMAQWWSDHLDRLRTGGDVVQFKKGA